MKRCFEFLWKGIVVGLLNIISLILAGSALKGMGLKLPDVQGSNNYILGIMFLSGFIISIMGGLLVKSLGLPRMKAFLALYLLFFLNVGTQLLEAIYFAPGIVTWEVAPFIFGQQFIMYLVMSAGITLLYKNDGKENVNSEIQRRSLADWSLRILTGAGSYVLFYYIFGSINASLFTRQYYTAQLDGLSLPSAMEIMALEPVRAVLLILSILPVVLNLNVSKQKCSVMVGMVLFIIGGLLPMLQQLNNLPTVLVISSTVEMFFQFFLTGVVATYVLLYEKSQKGIEV